MLFSVDECVQIILGVFYRTETHAEDRSSQVTIDKIDPISGLPTNESDRLGSFRALRGTDLAMVCVTSSFKLARACTYRVVGEEETTLAAIRPEDWTADEASFVTALETNFKKAVKLMASKGWVNENPNVGYEGERMDLKGDGHAFCFGPTYAGLVEARRVVPGTRQENGPTSIFAAIPKSLAAQSKSDWAKKE